MCISMLVYMCAYNSFMRVYAVVRVYVCRFEPGYNDTGLRDTSPIALDILRYQLIPNR